MAGAAEVISHWHRSVEGLSTSTLEFYASVEKALRAKEVPDLRIERTLANEHGILSAKREYLRVGYGRFNFDICGSPFGKDFFFSWWLVKRIPSLAALWGCGAIVGLPIVVLGFITVLGFFNGLFVALVAMGIGVVVILNVSPDGSAAIEDTILAIPVIGFLYAKFVKPVTYYSEDTRLMFEDMVHRTVVQVVEGILTLNKLPQLTPEQSKPKSRQAIS